ncbi:MAG: hypothetical protein ACRD6X_02515 [Pyrinomonadaceae bacterium]
MEEIRLTYTEALLYGLIPVAVGFVLGLIPLITGIIKKKIFLGVAGLIVSTIGGAILGAILSIPAMAVFTWLIIRDRFVETSERPNESAPKETADED